MASVAWGAGVFPDPESSVHSRLADPKNPYNETGFKDPKIDEIIEKYNRSFDDKERVALMHELDGLMTSQYHYVLRINIPSERIAYWNRFGQPVGYFTRTGDYQSSLSLGPGPERLWWLDPEKSKKVDQAMADSSVRLEVGETDVRYWQDYAKP
jgi:microcin C transport system substrate-binding protein